MNILPCPHCGKQPEIFQNEEYGPGGPIPTDWTIQCCASIDAHSEDKAIARWNKRFNCTKPVVGLENLTAERMLDAIRVWEYIRQNPGCELFQDYGMASELEAIGLVVSQTHDDGEDTWHVA